MIWRGHVFLHDRDTDCCRNCGKAKYQLMELPPDYCPRANDQPDKPVTSVWDAISLAGRS